jgi:uncharacterized protein YjbI with pentapeptide repeats
MIANDRAGEGRRGVMGDARSDLAAPGPERQSELQRMYAANLAAERLCCANIRLRSPGEALWVAQALGASGARDLSGADGSGLSFSGLDLSGIIFVEAMLAEASFAQANLSGAVFFKANLRAANFEGANLRDSVLDNADLRGASGVRADLRNASLFGANLGGANFDGAALDADTDLRDTLRDGATRIPSV